MIEDISNRLMREFATCLSSRLAEAPRRRAARRSRAGDAPPEAVAAAETPQEGADYGGASASAAAAADPRRGRLSRLQAAKPVGGIGLFFSVLWERIRRRFGRSTGPR